MNGLFGLEAAIQPKTYPTAFAFPHTPSTAPIGTSDGHHLRRARRWTGWVRRGRPLVGRKPTIWLSERRTPEAQAEGRGHTW